MCTWMRHGLRIRSIQTVHSRKTSQEDDEPVNAKSTLSVLTLDCHEGDQIEIITDGDDADDALAALVDLVDSGLGE
ncbi:hypothetical protein BH23ACT10_BH23ACT10_13200 [soil metagenome]